MENSLARVSDIVSPLRLCHESIPPEGDCDVSTASYFLSRITIVPTDAPGMPKWRKKLFMAVARNSANPVAYFGLPDDRTVVMGSHVTF